MKPKAFNQGEFNFEASDNEDGWRKWREELATAKLAFESRWGIVLGKPVIVTLKDFAKPVHGCLEWIEPARTTSKAAPRFRIGTLEFDHHEIESLSRT